jgi:crossover junction endodeoxyribonuclease RuvC
MRVLGIDPALAGPTGYGVVETDGRSYRSLDFGAVKARRTAKRQNGARSASAGRDIPARLREIHAAVARLLVEHTPDAVAVESVFTALNMRTALSLAEVRGVVLLAAAERGIPVHSYSPREVKSAVAGYGNADKHQMQQMVRVLLGMPSVTAGLGSDAADALAVALCHIYSSQAQARIAAATAPPASSAAHPLPAGNGNGHTRASIRTNGRRTARIQSPR